MKRGGAQHLHIRISNCFNAVIIITLQSIDKHFFVVLLSFFPNINYVICSQCPHAAAHTHTISAALLVVVFIFLLILCIPFFFSFCAHEMCMVKPRTMQEMAIIASTSNYYEVECMSRTMRLHTQMRFADASLIASNTDLYLQFHISCAANAY